MGLSLSGWLGGIPAKMKKDAPSSSSFLPLSIPTSSRLSLLLNSSPVDPGDPRCRWSPTHCSPHFLLSQCGEEVTRAPTQQISDGARGEKGERGGMHVWEVLWCPTHRGSHAVIGVSTEHCPLQTSGYTALMGGDSQSWGWELTNNQLWHAGQALGRYPGERGVQAEEQSVSPPHPVPERVLLVLDADTGTLGYVVDDCFLGMAFKDLPQGVELFPAISSVRGGAFIRLRYLNGATREYNFIIIIQFNFIIPWHVAWLLASTQTGNI